MQNLKAIQNELMRFIFDGNSSDLSCIKNFSGISGAERFYICKNTVISNLLSSLKITYPGVINIIGAYSAEKVFNSYIHNTQYLKPRNQINNFGDEFPEFINSKNIIKTYPYLGDYAMLELLRSKSYHSPKKKYMKPEEIMDILQYKNIDNIKMCFNESTYILKTNWPLDLVQELINKNRNFKKYKIRPEAKHILIFSISGKVTTLYLTKKYWTVITKLMQGKTISESISENITETNLTEIIKLLFQNQLITKITA